MPADHLGENLTDNPADAVEAVDKAVGESAVARRHHPLSKLLSKVGELGDQGPLYAIGAGIVGIGLLRKSPRTIVGGISMLAAVGAADALKSTVKKCVLRTRPHHAVEEGEYRFETGEPRKKEESSFPSGHAACTVAAANALSRVFPRYKPLAQTVSIFLTSTRILRGKHWPLDIFAGSLIGWLAERIVRGLTPRWVRHRLDDHSLR